MEEVAPQQENTFPGLPYPAPMGGHLQIPHPWFDEIISQIDNISEMKVVMYVYRHTCGYHKPFQAVTLSNDEFMNGRMKSNRERMDRGTGMSEKSVRNGIKSAKDHGYLVVEVDERDKARIRKSYKLKYDISPEGQSLPPESESEGQTLPPEGQSLHLGRETLPGRGAKSTPRTDKDKEKTSSKENGKETALAPEKRWPFIDQLATDVSFQLEDREHEEENKREMWEIFKQARAKKISEAKFEHEARSALAEVKDMSLEEIHAYEHENHIRYYFWYLCFVFTIPSKQLVHS